MLMGSAGGLLMGFLVNEASGLYNGIIAAVPFVDVITTMLDESIPLTTGEFDEWEIPKQKILWLHKILFSYDNVKKQTYPNLLVTSGLHDSQVQYWEPAKWVARLRLKSINKNKIFYTQIWKLDMEELREDLILLKKPQRNMLLF